MFSLFLAPEPEPESAWILFPVLLSKIGGGRVVGSISFINQTEKVINYNNILENPGEEVLKQIFVNYLGLFCRRILSTNKLIINIYFMLQKVLPDIVGKQKTIRIYLIVNYSN